MNERSAFELLSRVWMKITPPRLSFKINRSKTRKQKNKKSKSENLIETTTRIIIIIREENGRSLLHRASLLLLWDADKEMRHKTMPPLTTTPTPTSRGFWQTLLVCLTLYLTGDRMRAFCSPSNSALLMHQSAQSTQSAQYQQQQQQQDASHLFSCGKLYYRTFLLDQQRNILYVGAM